MLAQDKFKISIDFYPTTQNDEQQGSPLPRSALALNTSNQCIGGNSSAFSIPSHISCHATEMVRLMITPAISAAIREAQRSSLDLSRTTEAPEPSLDNPSIGDPISHGQIIALSKLLRHVNDEPEEPPQPMASYHLDDLLRGTRIYHEPPKRKAEPVGLRCVPNLRWVTDLL